MGNPETTWGVTGLQPCSPGFCKHTAAPREPTTPAPCGSTERVAAGVQYKGTVFAHKAMTVAQILPLLRKVAQLEEEAPLLVCEEIKSEPTVMCEALHVHETILRNQLEDGDILVVQRTFSEVGHACGPCPALAAGKQRTSMRAGACMPVDGCKCLPGLDAPAKKVCSAVRSLTAPALTWFL